MTTHFSITALENTEAALTADDGTVLRCPAALLPEGAAVGKALWLTLEQPASSQSILNEILKTDTNHGPS